MKNKKNKIVYEHISRIEALAKIDAGDIEDLYFVYTCLYAKFGFKTSGYMAKGKKEIFEPIKYEPPIKGMFRILNRKNQPEKKSEDNFVRDVEHQWLIKKTKGFLDYPPKPAFLLKPKWSRLENREEVEVGDLVIKRGKNQADVRFVEDVNTEYDMVTIQDKVSILLSNGREDLWYEGEDGVRNFHKQWRLLSKSKDLLREDEVVPFGKEYKDV